MCVCVLCVCTLGRQGIIGGDGVQLGVTVEGGEEHAHNPPP